MPQNNPMAMMGQLKQTIGMLCGQDPRQVVQLMAQRNPQFAAFLQQNQGKSAEQIAAENGIFTKAMAAGETVTFDQVLAVVDGEVVNFGAPVLEGASVTAKVLKNGKSKKITVFKYRPKKDSKSIRGHRQPYTKVQIEKISV